jgi:tetratricopeptide (TPR) repeat protein
VLTAIESRESRKFTGFWDTAETYRLLGRIQLDMALHDDALASLERAVEARPQSARSWHLLGQAQLNIEAYAEAEASLRKAAGFRSDAKLRADLGIALLGQQQQEGERLLSEALDTPGAGNFLRHASLGLHLVELKKFEKAQVHLGKALRYRETANTRAALALAQWRLGDRENAYDNLSIAMQMDEEPNPYVERINTVINGHESLLIGH